MNMEDIYVRFESLMTPEEIEDVDYEPAGEVVHSIPDEMGRLFELAIPDMDGREEFNQRKPAMGLSLGDVDAIEDHYYNQLPPGVQQRRCEKYLRHSMLRSLISTTECEEFRELCNVLREEINSGKPAPVPEWYVFAEETYGPRRIGYKKCENRGCFKTESLDEKFMQCSKCHLAAYCGRDCQAEDWNIRHKKLCKKAVQMRERTQAANRAIEQMKDAIS